MLYRRYIVEMAVGRVGADIQRIVCVEMIIFGNVVLACHTICGVSAPFYTHLYMYTLGPAPCHERR